MLGGCAKIVEVWFLDLVVIPPASHEFNGHAVA